ncbi:MAG TPA: hypothetical protein VFQ39_12195 [Longimicrobium sp.]|nr:hypothetical protein [Longimicrobium sp.]
MAQLRVEDIRVASFETGSAESLAACTPTLDSLVEEICPNGEITNTCHETTVPE